MIPTAAQVGLSPGEVFLGMSSLKLVVGLGITVVGFQGYRRNRSRPMLFLALGIAGITFLSTLAALLSEVLLAETFPWATALTTEFVELLGVLAIAYSLYLLKRG